MPEIVIYKGEKLSKKRVWYTGSDALEQGYAVCYDRDTITAKDGTGAAIGIGSSSWGRHSWVEKPASGNLHNFAGIVGKKYAAKTGGQQIEIIIPTPGTVYDLYTDQNCTEDSTFLCVQAGSYLFGGIGTGPIVGYATQTVDRSGTNGLVQAIIRGVDPFNLPYGVATPSGTVNVFSSAIWESCPWNEIQNNPGLGYAFFDDFISAQSMASATAQGPYLTYQDIGVTIAPLETSDEVGGVIEVANNDADNDEGHIGLGSTALFNLMKIASSGGKPCWFEARLKKAGVGNNGVAVFIGVGEEGFIAADSLVDNTGEVADKDFVGFQTLHADGDALVPCYKKSGQTKQTGTSVAITADTYFNCGFVFDGSTLTGYVNNASKLSVTDVSAATFPDGEEMTPILLTKVGAAAEVAVQMDWWRFAQLR